MTYFTKHCHPPGTSPGILIQRDKEQRAPLTILLTDYNMPMPVSMSTWVLGEAAAMAIVREGRRWQGVPSELVSRPPLATLSLR